MKNQKGFLSLALLLTLVFMSVLFFLATVFSALNLKNSALFACRNALLQSQQKTQEKIYQLLAENPHAESLHAQEEMTRQNLRMAMGAKEPVTVALLKIELARIRAQLAALDAKQKLLVRTADLSLRQGVIQASKEVREFYNNDKLPQHLRAQVQISSLGNPKTGVRVSSSHKIAPQYSVKNSMEVDQKQTLLWTTRFQNIHGRPYFKIISLEDKCQVTTKFKKPQRFEMAVSMGKY